MAIIAAVLGALVGAGLIGGASWSLLRNLHVFRAEARRFEFHECKLGAVAWKMNSGENNCDSNEILGDRFRSNLLTGAAS